MTTLEAGIVSVDAAALAAFYQQALGFETHLVLTFPQGEVHRLRRDRAELKIYQPADGARERPMRDPWFADTGFAYAALHVDDAEVEVQRVTAAGGTVLTPVTAHRPGARFALIADPDGNVWEILEETPDA